MTDRSCRKTQFGSAVTNRISRGPWSGSLVVQGGGSIAPAIRDKFVTLAGGQQSTLVFIPTASLDDKFARQAEIIEPFGFKHIIVLHTRDRVVADSEEFVAPLRNASAVWIGGGRQWRLVDAYLNTLTEKAIRAVLARGGVVGGTSAGASILASYLARGAPEGNHIVMAPGYETGFGFLRNVAIDQHVSSRGRESDLATIVIANPGLLGIGIDESTAIIVKRDRFEVVGLGKVVVTDGLNHEGKPYFFLSEGDRFNLRSRTKIRARRSTQTERTGWGRSRSEHHLHDSKNW